MFTGNLEALLNQVDPALQTALRNELREQGRQTAIESVKFRYDPKRYKDVSRGQTGGYNSQIRRENAQMLGLTPIGRESAFASMVAVHPQFDDMVIKVVDWDDAGAWYLRACHSGEISGPHVPVVYAVHKLGKQAFIYMERLTDVINWKENICERVEGYNNYFLYGEDAKFVGVIKPIESMIQWHINFTHWNENLDASFGTDYHTGNVMVREDGTLVMIDPVHGEADTASMRIAKQEEAAHEALMQESCIAGAADVVPMFEMAVSVVEYYCPRRRQLRRRAGQRQKLHPAWQDKMLREARLMMEPMPHHQINADKMKEFALAFGMGEMKIGEIK